MACLLDGAKPLSQPNAGILLIERLGTNFSEILIGIQIFSFNKMRLKMSSVKWRPFCLGLNVLNTWINVTRQWEIPTFLIPGQWSNDTRVHNIKTRGLNWCINSSLSYLECSTFHEICAQFYCVLFCCGYIWFFLWIHRSFYPYSSGILHWHWGNHKIAPMPWGNPEGYG